MKRITDWGMRQYFRYRQKGIERAMSQQHDSQENLRKLILRSNSRTEIGRRYGFDRIRTLEAFQSAVPLMYYEDIYPYIERMMQGEQEILVSRPVNWFAKSSGTSTGRSKYIPVTREYLLKGHLKCAWDAASFIYNEDRQARLFADKSLIMGGSVETLPSGLRAGDISGIIIKHFPAVGRAFYTPDFETALMADWDRKIKRMAEICARERMVLVAGVPTWLLVLFRTILDQTGAENLAQVWPGLRSFLHGGVSFEPYRNQFEALLPLSDLRYREVYNASEGYFAIQDRWQGEGMLLQCNHGIFYEFIPWNGSGLEEDMVTGISGVEKGKTYALAISNISGLYRYVIGDLVTVVHVRPVRLKVAGRVTAMINVFGEELSVINADEALGELSREKGVSIKEYTVGPLFMNAGEPGAHHWYIEFIEPPRDLADFTSALDQKLREINSDYDAKRSGNLAMSELRIKVLPSGCFESWMRARGKFGGQNKVPRLKNDRQLLDELDAISG